MMEGVPTIAPEALVRFVTEACPSAAAGWLGSLSDVVSALSAHWGLSDVVVHPASQRSLVASCEHAVHGRSYLKVERPGVLLTSPVALEAWAWSGGGPEVLAVDVDRERISLGIKQLDSDPFTTFVSVNDKGQVVTGKVKTVDARGAEIDLGEDIIGYLRASEISRDRVEDARNVLKEGDEVTAVVVNVDRKTRNIQLSIKQKDMIDEQGAMANLSQQSSRESAGTTSLGALLRAKLDNSEK